VLVAVQQLAQNLFGSATRSFRPFLPTHTVSTGGVRVGIDQIIVVVIAAAGTLGLTQLLRLTRLGLSMRGVVDNESLIALTGIAPVSVRRGSWVIGSVFAALSGVLIAPTIGLDAGVLTLLVVQAFGAAAFGLFTSLPLTYVGGLVLGVGSALSSKYVGSVRILSGLPPSLPFIVLFCVLVAAPRGRLIDIAPERRGIPRERRQASRHVRISASAAGCAALIAVPFFAGARLTGYSVAMAFAVIFLSLVLLDRLSGQLSLAQLSFSAVGGTAFSHLAHGFGLPWLVAVLLGALIAVPVGAVLAVPAVRLSGLYLALASFGFGLLMQGLVYGQSYMFGASGTAIQAPRPSFAHSDRAYYYVVLAFALAAAGLVVALRRSPLGRLLRAMADSQVAVVTGGMNVTALKLIAFCLSAFLAGLGGALLGPAIGSLAPANLDTFASLLLVVILALQAPLGDVPAAFVAALVSGVVPSYLVQHPGILKWLPVAFGMAAVGISIRQGRSAIAGSRPASIIGDRTRERLLSSPVRARHAQETANPARLVDAST